MLRTLLLTAVALAAVACASAPPTDAVPASPVAPGDTPGAVAAPQSDATPSGGEKAAACPLFCDRKGGACSRPDIQESELPGLSCGKYSMGAFDKLPRSPCPESCCAPAAAGSGDADADGITAPTDKCETAPEDRDGFEDADGCPDPDNDRDGLEDVKDVCCYVAEDADGKEDLDGCPEPG